jgi:hypothetical protein
MSGSPENIKSFIDPLLEKCREGCQKDTEVLAEFKQEGAGGDLPGSTEGGGGSVEIHAHDTAYYSNLRMKRDYGVDSEAIRQYFPLDHVVKVTLEIYQELLSLVFVEIKDFDTWHPDVRLFRVNDEASGEKMGFFYIDLHPREGKYVPIRTRLPESTRLPALILSNSYLALRRAGTATPLSSTCSRGTRTRSPSTACCAICPHLRPTAAPRCSSTRTS